MEIYLPKLNRDDVETIDLIPHYQEAPMFPVIDCVEKQLIAAMIEQAVIDLSSMLKAKERTGGSKQYIRSEADYWIAYEGDEPWTFRWCCNQIGLCYVQTRDKLRERGLMKRELHLDLPMTKRKQTEKKRWRQRRVKARMKIYTVSRYV